MSKKKENCFLYHKRKINKIKHDSSSSYTVVNVWFNGNYLDSGFIFH